MLVRLLLVSVVAGLGVSAPSPKQVDEWSRSAQSIWRTALVRWDALMPRTEIAAVEPDATPAAGVPPIAEVIRVLAEERAFGNVVDEMAASFIAAQELAGATDASPGRLAAVAPPVVAASDLRFETCLEADGYALGDDRAAEPPASASAEPAEAAPGRLDRLASAVRLTRDAARAWAGCSGPARRWRASGAESPRRSGASSRPESDE